MITNIPSADDFQESGMGFLNLAWDTISSIAITWGDAEAQLWKTSANDPNTYWMSAQKPLATALVLACQGVEMLLKSKICEVSPFLLIAGDPRGWPAKKRFWKYFLHQLSNNRFTRFNQGI
jgi:hypothetical protein